MFINGIRGIIDGVSRSTGVCPQTREREGMHFRRCITLAVGYFAIKPIDRVVIWIHASRRPHLLSTPFSLCIPATLFARLADPFANWIMHTVRRQIRLSARIDVYVSLYLNDRYREERNKKKRGFE